MKQEELIPPGSHWILIRAIFRFFFTLSYYLAGWKYGWKQNNSIPKQRNQIQKYYPIKLK